MAKKRASRRQKDEDDFEDVILDEDSNYPTLVTPPLPVMPNGILTAESKTAEIITNDVAAATELIKLYFGMFGMTKNVYEVIALGREALVTIERRRKLLNKPHGDPNQGSGQGGAYLMPIP